MEIKTGAERQGLLASVHAMLRCYETSEEPFERARLLSQIGKTYTPRLLLAIEELLAENAKLREALEPFAAATAEALRQDGVPSANRLTGRDFERALAALGGQSL